MRRLGDQLGVEAMSLYNHLPNKAALLDGVFEKVLSELPPPGRSKSWTEALRKQALRFRDVLRSHPNVLPLFSTRVAVTVESMVHIEASLDLLHKARFSPRDALSVLGTLVAYVVGHSFASYAPPDPDETAPNYEHASKQVFPRVREAAELLVTHDVESEFAFGLDAMLRGFDALRRAKVRRAG
jgi:AcrR family transcriptional regulator